MPAAPTGMTNCDVLDVKAISITAMVPKWCLGIASTCMPAQLNLPLLISQSLKCNIGFPKFKDECLSISQIMLCRHQFVKLLMYIDQHFVNEIIERGLEDARSAVRRLRQYLQGQEFLREPLGCKLEMYDASSYDRA